MPSLKTLAKNAGSLIRPGYLRLPLTGSPSSGKTSVKTYLEKLGFTTITEFPAQIIDEYKRGLHNLHPEVDMYPFNAENFSRQIKAEKELKRFKLIIPDRSMYDPEAYFRKFGIPLPDYLEALPDNLYNLAFAFENLPFVNDGIRYEDAKFAEEIKDFFPAAYNSHGVETVTVEVYPCTKNELTKEELQVLAEEKEEKLYEAKLKQLLIDKSVEKRALFIINTIKERFPEAALPAGV